MTIRFHAGQLKALNKKNLEELEDKSQRCSKIQVESSPRYEPLHLTDAVVEQLAQHFYTAEEIADFFNVPQATLLAKHGDAFRKGKLFHSMKPRILFDKMITDIMNSEGDYSDKEMEHLFQRAKSLIELKWKKTEGYGKETVMHHTASKLYDAVETVVEILERPLEDEDSSA